MLSAFLQKRDGERTIIGLLLMLLYVFRFFLPDTSPNRPIMVHGLSRYEDNILGGQQFVVFHDEIFDLFAHAWRLKIERDGQIRFKSC